MRITTRNITNRGCPPLWQIVVDGKDLDGGRVLKMGQRYLAVSDQGGLANFGSFEKRSDAAKHVVQYSERRK